MGDPIQAVEQEIEAFNQKLAQVYTEVKSLAVGFAKEMMRAGRILEADLPYVVDALQVTGAIMAMVPGAGGAGAAMLTAASAVETFDKAVVTADGIVMDPAEALTVFGREKAAAMAPASAEQRRLAAVAQVTRRHGAPTNSADAIVALAYARRAKIDPALAPPSSASSSSAPAPAN